MTYFLIDDIQFIIGKESTQEEFFHTFNDLHSNKKQIIISSDKPPKEMQTLEGRLRSRFEWGLIADISSPDYETRMAILRKKEELDGYQVNDEVIKYIATNIKSNIRELEGALNKLMACSRLEKKEITIEMAEQELRDIISSGRKTGGHSGAHHQYGGGALRNPSGRHQRKETKFRDCLSQTDCHVSLQGDHRYPLKVHRNHNGEKRPHHSYPRLQHHRRRHGKIRIHTQYRRDYQEENHTELTVIHRLRTKVPQKYSTAGTLDFTGFRTVIHKFTAPKNMTTDFL